jgi:hypothetical protein
MILPRLVDRQSVGGEEDLKRAGIGHLRRRSTSPPFPEPRPCRGRQPLENGPQRILPVMNFPLVWPVAANSMCEPGQTRNQHERVGVAASTPSLENGRESGIIATIHSSIANGYFTIIDIWSPRWSRFPAKTGEAGRTSATPTKCGPKIPPCTRGVQTGHMGKRCVGSRVSFGNHVNDSRA